jgi:hypothetical protein
MISTRLFAVSQLYTHDCGFFRRSPTSRCVRFAPRRRFLSRDGTARYLATCRAFVAMPGIYKTSGLTRVPCQTIIAVALKIGANVVRRFHGSQKTERMCGMIRFRCTGCGKAIKAPDEFAGRKCKCLRCGEINTIPVTQSVGRVEDPNPTNIRQSRRHPMCATEHFRFLVVILSLVWTGTLCPVLADVIVSKSGTRWEGKVTDEGTHYSLITASGGKMNIPKSMVNEVIRKTLPAAPSHCSECRNSGYTPCPPCKARGFLECPKCKGTGAARCKSCIGTGKTSNGSRCKPCGGRGDMYFSRRTEKKYRSCFGQVDTPKSSILLRCLGCGGTGYAKKCSACRGEGKSLCVECEGVSQFSEKKPDYILPELRSAETLLKFLRTFPGKSNPAKLAQWRKKLAMFRGKSIKLRAWVRGIDSRGSGTNALIQCIDGVERGSRGTMIIRGMIKKWEAAELVPSLGTITELKLTGTIKDFWIFEQGRFVQANRTGSLSGRGAIKMRQGSLGLELAKMQFSVVSVKETRKIVSAPLGGTSARLGRGPVSKFPNWKGPWRKCIPCTGSGFDYEAKRKNTQHASIVAPRHGNGITRTPIRYFCSTCGGTGMVPR